MPEIVTAAVVIFGHCQAADPGSLWRPVFLGNGGDKGRQLGSEFEQSGPGDVLIGRKTSQPGFGIAHSRRVNFL